MLPLMSATSSPVEVPAWVSSDNLPDSWPSLENGDRMDREEFHRRYKLRPDIKKAELIEGTVYLMSSPVRAKAHGGPHKLIIYWLASYERRTPRVNSWIDTTLRLDGGNEPRPDAVLRLDEACGGRSRVAPDDYLEGAPELIVEIAASSVSIDLHAKKKAYRQAGVREYLVWRTEQGALDWFVLREGAYQPLAPDAQGVIESEIFPGLRLSVVDLLADRLEETAVELERGLDSDAHRAFVEQLKQAAG
jgi:Uma2 family endonuclease